MKISTISVALTLLSVCMAVRLGLYELTPDHHSLANLTSLNACFKEHNEEVYLKISGNHLTLLPLDDTYVLSNMATISECIDRYPIEQVIKYNVTIDWTNHVSSEKISVSDRSGVRQAILGESGGLLGQDECNGKLIKRCGQDAP